MTSRQDRIKQMLSAVFTPEQLDIIDESAKHASHVARTGAHGGETHYRVLMVSPALTGLSRLARHRKVLEALDAEFKTGLHALSLVLRTPEEASS